MLLRFTDNVILQLTRDCNLQCKFCFQGKKEEWKGKELSFENFTQIVDTAIYERCVLANLDNYINFHFHGGEVTLIAWDKLKRMMDYVLSRKAYFKGITMCMQTNGLLLTEEICEYCNSNDISIGLSIDSLSEEGHLTPEETEKLIEHLKYLHQKTGIKFGNLSVLSTVNMKTWYRDMENLLSNETFKEAGVNIICTHPEEDYLVPTPEDQWMYWIEPVLKSYLTDMQVRERNLDIVMSKVLQEIVFESKNGEDLKTGCFDRICGHWANMIAIDPLMKIYGCDKYLESGDFINLKKGYSVDQRDFLAMQQAKEAIKFYSKIRKLEIATGCDTCEARWLCNGECQSYMLSKYGEYKLNPSICDVYRRIYAFIYEHWIEILKHSHIEYIGTPLRVRTSALYKLNKENLAVRSDESGKFFVGENI